MSEEGKKWTVNLGPRIAKPIVEALKELSYQHHYSTEKTGIIGVDERSWAFQTMFGGRREDVAQAQHALGEKYGWLITRENMDAILAEIKGLIETLKASAPCEDKRVTPEAHAATQALIQKQRDEQEQAQRKRTEARAAGMAQALYPWAKRDGSNYARGSSNLKRLLGIKFPGVAFSVRSDAFSMGNSIDVSWTDGPTAKQVEEISDLFCTSTTEQSGGDRINVPCSTGFTDWMGGGKYVHSQRNISEHIERAVGEAIAKRWGVEMPADLRKRFYVAAADKDLSDLIHMTLTETAIPANGVFIGFSDNEEDKAKVGNWAEYCLFKVPETSTVAVADVQAPNGTRVVHNTKLGGVEIWFAGKPSDEIMGQCRAAGFRLSRVGGWHWWHKYGAYAWAQAHKIAGVELPAENASLPKSEADAFDMQVEDNMAEAAGVGGVGYRD